jgi:hypothetical protein
MARTASPMSSPAARGESRFWECFGAHCDALSNSDTGQESVVAVLQAELRRYCSGLTAVLNVAVEPKELIISADGVRSYFPKARRLVAAAPALPGWSFTPLRPPRVLNPQGLTVPSGEIVWPDDLWFRPAPESGGIDLIIAVPDRYHLHGGALASGLFLMGDDLLGEELAGTTIEAIGWCPVQADPASLGLKPIRKLPGLRSV